MNYYVAVDQEVSGPFTDEQLAGMLEVGQIASETLVTPEGAEHWRPLSEVLEFPAMALPGETDPLVTATEPVPTALGGNPLNRYYDPARFRRKARWRLIVGSGALFLLSALFFFVQTQFELIPSRSGGESGLPLISVFLGFVYLGLGTGAAFGVVACFRVAIGLVTLGLVGILFGVVIQLVHLSQKGNGIPPGMMPSLILVFGFTVVINGLVLWCLLVGLDGAKQLKQLKS